MKVTLIEKDVMVTSLVESYLADKIRTLTHIHPSENVIDTLKLDPPDLIVLDFTTKTLDGNHLLLQIRLCEQLALIPIVAIAAFVSADNLQEFLHDKLTGILLKPFAQSVFESTMKRCLRNKMLLSIDTDPDTGTKSAHSNVNAVEIDGYFNKVDQINEKANRVVDSFYYDPFPKSSVTPESPIKRLNLADRLKLIENLPIKTALIVDRDLSVQKTINSQLKEKNVLEIVNCDNGDVAWRHYRESPFDLVIISADIPGLSTLGFYNRIRLSNNSRYKPMLILTGRSDNESWEELIREDPCLSIVKKPFSNAALVETVSGLLGRSSVQGDLEKAVFDCISNLDQSAMMQSSIQEICSAHPSAESTLLTVMDRKIKSRDFSTAENVGKFLLGRPKFDINVATRFSKIYQHTGNLNTAAEILQCANVISPSNLKRLLQTSEVGFERLQADIAKEYLTKILKIDQDHEQAKAGLFVADSLLKITNTKSAKQLADGQGLLSTLNTIGINYAKQKNLDEAEKYYASAMLFVRDPMDKAKLSYNIGLAYWRAANTVRAYEFFARADRLSQGKLEKTKNYLTRYKKKP